MGIVKQFYVYGKYDFFYWCGNKDEIVLSLLIVMLFFKMVNISL